MADHDTYDKFQARDRGRFGDGDYARSDQVEKTRLADVEVGLVYSTVNGGLLVTVDGYEQSAKWVPAAWCEVEKLGETDVVMRDGTVARRPKLKLTLKQSQAREKGLI